MPGAHKEQKEQGGCLWGVSAVLCLAVLLLSLPAGCTCSLALEQWLQESVYLGDVNTVNPELEGRLVKMALREVRTDTVLEDPLFGLRGNWTVLTRSVFDSRLSTIPGESQIGEEVDVEWGTMERDGIRECRFTPARVQSGAFTLLHPRGVFIYTPELLPLSPREQWPELLQQKGEAECGSEVILWRGEQKDDYATVRFRAASPGVLDTPIYVLARQRGNVLDFTEAHTGRVPPEIYPRLKNVGDMDGYDGLGLALYGLLAIVSTPLAFLVLVLHIRHWRANGSPFSPGLLAVVVSGMCILPLLPWLFVRLLPPVGFLVIALLLPLALLLILRLCRPRFSPRLSALLYLPGIVLWLAAVQPVAFHLEQRLLLAGLALLYALVACFISRRSSVNQSARWRRKSFS